jgi:hypothetical protein
MASKGIAERTALGLCEEAALPHPARRLLQPDLTAPDFLALLMKHGHAAEAVRLVARALPGRKAVWWACVCVRHAAADLPQAENAALVAAVRWVVQPNPEHAQTAKSAAGTVGMRTPAGCAARAAANAEQNKRGAAAAVAGGAALLAAAHAPLAKRRTALQEFVALGLEIDLLPEPWKRAHA